MVARYIPWAGAASALVSDTVYHWGVRAFVGDMGTATAWANATFQTALMAQSDWAGSEWISAPGGDSPGQFASNPCLCVCLFFCTPCYLMSGIPVHLPLHNLLFHCRLNASLSLHSLLSHCRLIVLW